MSGLIIQTGSVFESADGKQAEVIYEGSDEDGLDKWKRIESLKKPRKLLETFMILNDGYRVRIPVKQVPHILPDKTGVLVIFEESESESSYFISFDYPDNAAIFNADGSLRFRLKNPWKSSASFRRVQLISDDGTTKLGVRACPMNAPNCDEVYIVDGSTAELSTHHLRFMPDR
jgi:hypothetical protein